MSNNIFFERGQMADKPNNYLWLGDCLELMKDIPDEYVDLILTDPPYKTTSRGSSGGTGGILKDDLNKKGMVFKHNTISFNEWLPECYRVLKNNSHAYFMTNNKNLKDMIISVEKAGFSIFKTLIWVKNTSITNMYYMDTHEYVIFCRKGKAKKINNCGTKSVLNYKNPKNKNHPTEKPIDLLTTLIENSTNVNDIVLDPFVGCGSTTIASYNSDRFSIGIELDIDFYNVAKKRVKKNILLRANK